MIKVNVTKMFVHREPWDCSNSIANLGDQVARLTWQCATEVATHHADWLLTDLLDTLEAVRDWARDTGAWDDTEIADWGTGEVLALLVQNVASDLRTLGSDNEPLEALVDDLEAHTDELSYIMHMYNENNETFAEVAS